VKCCGRNPGIGLVTMASFSSARRLLLTWIRRAKFVEEGRHLCLTDRVVLISSVLPGYLKDRVAIPISDNPVPLVSLVPSQMASEIRFMLVLFVQLNMMGQ
jgi:hypothetical protein